MTPSIPHLTIIVKGCKIEPSYDLNQRGINKKAQKMQQDQCCLCRLSQKKTERVVVSWFAEAGLREYQTRYGLTVNQRQDSLILKARLNGLKAVLEACEKKDPSSVLYWRGDRNVRKIITDIAITQSVIAERNKEQVRLDMTQSSKNLPVLKKRERLDARQVIPSVVEEG